MIELVLLLWLLVFPIVGMVVIANEIAKMTVFFIGEAIDYFKNRKKNE